MMPIRCEIVSQDRIVYQGDADIVLLPGSEGEMGILPNHSPLLTMLRFGVITVRVKGREDEYYAVSGGVAEIQPDQVTVLADAAENVEEIDVQRAEEARQRVEDMLKEGVAPDTDQYMALRAALLRSQLRVKAVERYRRRQRRDIRHNQQDS
jgi:F-type H+-transporting ATPase subunit epsilon